MTLKQTALSLLLSSVLFSTSPAAATEPSVTSSLITWDAAPSLKLTLTVAHDGEVTRHEFGAGETATFGAYDKNGQPLADGSYTWQLIAAPVLSEQQREILNAEGKGSKALELAGTTRSGFFSVSGGAFVTPTPSTPSGDGFNKAQVIADDLIVPAHACIGDDCANDESFGLITQILKANNVRLRFEDTSASNQFPSNDWELEINDTTNGGGNYFAVRDVTGDAIPFTLEAAAGADALYVAAGGNVGLGVAVPMQELHMLGSDGPSMRLEQDGASGFAPQTWDVGGHEVSFFVRDVTAGTVPFEVETGAPTNAFRVDGDGNVAIGVKEPKARLHIENTSGNNTDDLVVTGAGDLGLGTIAPAGKLHIENDEIDEADDVIVTGDGELGIGTEAPVRPIHIKTGQAQVAFENTNATTRWNVGSNNDGSFVISRNNSGSRELQIYESGDIYFRNGTDVLAVLDANGNLTTTGTITTSGTTCGGGCDLVFQSGYELETIEEHAAFMWENSFLPSVGPTIENGAAWNLSEKTGGMLNELEKAHIYIEQLNDKVKSKDARINSLEERLVRLEALLTAE